MFQLPSSTLFLCTVCPQSYRQDVNSPPPPCVRLSKHNINLSTGLSAHRLVGKHGPYVTRQPASSRPAQVKDMGTHIAELARLPAARRSTRLRPAYGGNDSPVLCCARRAACHTQPWRRRMKIHHAALPHLIIHRDPYLSSYHPAMTLWSFAFGVAIRSPPRDPIYA